MLRLERRGKGCQAEGLTRRMELGGRGLEVWEGRSGKGELRPARGGQGEAAVDRGRTPVHSVPTGLVAPVRTGLVVQGWHVFSLPLHPGEIRAG